MRTIGAPTSVIPPFLCRMPFLLQTSQFILALDRHQIMLACIPGDSATVQQKKFSSKLSRSVKISVPRDYISEQHQIQAYNAIHIRITYIPSESSLFIRSSSVTSMLINCPNVSSMINCNNNNNSHDNVYGAVIMTQSHCESSPGSSDECRLSAGWPPTLRPSQST